MVANFLLKLLSMAGFSWILGELSVGIGALVTDSMDGISYFTAKISLLPSCPFRADLAVGIRVSSFQEPNLNGHEKNYTL
jgi:hypothetical protein